MATIFSGYYCKNNISIFLERYKMIFNISEALLIDNFIIINGMRLYFHIHMNKVIYIFYIRFLKDDQYERTVRNIGK